MSSLISFQILSLRKPSVCWCHCQFRRIQPLFNCPYRSRTSQGKIEQDHNAVHNSQIYKACIAKQLGHPKIFKHCTWCMTLWPMVPLGLFLNDILVFRVGWAASHILSCKQQEVTFSSLLIYCLISVKQKDLRKARQWELFVSLLLIFLKKAFLFNTLRGASSLSSKRYSRRSSSWPFPPPCSKHPQRAVRGTQNKRSS